MIIEDLRNIKTPVILVINKMDQIEEADLFKLMEMYNKKEYLKE